MADGERDEAAFHFDEDLAAVLNREPAGRGRFGHEVKMEPTPGRIQYAETVGPEDEVREAAAGEAPSELEDQVPDAEGPFAPGELAELPRGFKTDGRAIYVPPRPGILIGQLMVDAQGQPLPINAVDPRGGPWKDGESNDYLYGLVQEFLAGKNDALEFTNPVEGHTFLLTRYCLERLLMVATSRMEIKEPPVPDQTPGGIPIVRDLDARELSPVDRRQLRRSLRL